tara:strand:- start:251 stop:1390 length:1140 start_codon:yes stop_codon:yes gene_type:complete
MKWYNIKNENKLNIAEQKKYRDVFILDEIGGYGVYARTFIRDLMDIEADVINLHIDSAGGSITDGVAIYNALRAHSAEVHTYVDGIAASIASIIYLAGDERYIPENAGIFTHLPMLAEMDMPNRNDLQEAQEHLAKFEQVLANIYMKHTGADEETVRLWMENDTWFFGQEAVDSGFATQVVDKVAVAAQYDPKKYKFLEGKHPSLQVDAETKTPEQEAINMDEVRSEADIEVQDEVVADEVVTDVVEETASEIVEQVADEVSEVEDIDLETEDLVDEAIETEDVLAESQERAVALNDLAKKYDINGDLQQAVIDAIIAGTSLEDFKDQVLEVVANRVTSKALENNNVEVNDIESLREQLAKEKSSTARADIARKIRALR